MLNRQLKPARQALGESEATNAWLHGRAMSSEDALDDALGSRNEPTAFALSRASMANRAIPLTNCEQDVARLVVAGRRNRQIAQALVITEGTVKRHVENILMKLGLGSCAQLTAWAVANGLWTSSSGHGFRE